MGQAKLRGSLEERIKQGIEKRQIEEQLLAERVKKGIEKRQIEEQLLAERVKKGIEKRQIEEQLLAELEIAIQKKRQDVRVIGFFTYT